MNHPDLTDQASQIEERHRELALQRLRNQPQEEPDEDKDGNRYCLTCGEIIPEERVKAVQAVRCVHCASAREKQRKRLAQS